MNKVEGGPYLAPLYRTKSEAAQAGRSEARLRRTEHVVHNVDGSIAEEHSYTRRL